jgi:hypothetical protein
MAFSIDTSLQVGGLCYLLLTLPSAALWRVLSRQSARQFGRLHAARAGVPVG